MFGDTAVGNGFMLVTTDDMEALSDIIPMTAEYAYVGDFPGYVGREAIHRPTQAFIPPRTEYAPPNATDNQGGHIDYTSWGEMGEVDRNAYSIYGPVEPNSVENFALMGQVLPGQRRPEYGDGPVGAYDHATYTSLQIAQQMADVAYNEAAISDVLLGGF